MSGMVTAAQIRNGYRPSVGQLVEGARPGLYVKVVRWNSDGWDYRRCAICGEQFCYGPIGERVTDKALVCFTYDCTPKDGARPAQPASPAPANGGECPDCGRIMSWREAWEQGGCNDCTGGAR